MTTDRAGLTCGSTGSKVEVSTQPILGQDETLADDFKVGELIVGRSDAFPDTQRDVAGLGRTAYAWTSTPGTYWQMSVCSLKLPMRTVTIATPAPAATPLATYATAAHTLHKLGSNRRDDIVAAAFAYGRRRDAP